MPPAGHLAFVVEGHFNALDRHGVIEAVAHIVFARPLHQDWYAAHFLADERCFLDEVGLRFAAKAAAEQGHVEGDIFRLQLEGRDDVVLSPEWALGGRPYFGLAVFYLRHRDQGFHGRWYEMLSVIVGGEYLRGVGERFVGIALLADDFTRLRGRRRHFFVVSNGVVAGVGTMIPLNDERVAALHGGVGIVGDHCDAAQDTEFARHRIHAFDLMHGDDARHFQRRSCVELFDLAAEHGRPRHDGEFHARQTNIGAVNRLARCDVAMVGNFCFALTHHRKFVGTLELQRVDRWHGQRHSGFRQFAKA